MRHVSHAVGADLGRSVIGSDHRPGEVMTFAELSAAKEALVRHNAFGTDAGQTPGALNLVKAYQATTEKRWNDIGKVHQWKFMAWSAAVTLCCAMLATFVADLPDSYGNKPWGFDINYIVDPAANGLFIVLLMPLLKYRLANWYADNRMNVGQPRLADAAPLDAAMSPADSLREWNKVYWDQHDSAAYFSAPVNAVKMYHWQHGDLSRETSVQYFSMQACSFYDKGMTRAVLLSLLPLLVSRLPGLGREGADGFQVGNYFTEVAIGFTVLSCHDWLRQKVVSNLAHVLGALTWSVMACVTNIAKATCLRPRTAASAASAAVGDAFTGGGLEMSMTASHQGRGARHGSDGRSYQPIGVAVGTVGSPEAGHHAADALAGLDLTAGTEAAETYQAGRTSPEL